MENKNSTKKALIASILVLCLCFTSLIGTTFAWFTDSVTSSGNIIQTGSLKVGMYWAEGDEDPDTFNDWKDASKGAIFKNTPWEPGYTEAKHIKIVNEGTLALKYQMRILATGIVSELADVIDVYYFYNVDNADDLTGAVQLDRANFVEANRLGTLSEVLKNNMTVDGNIVANGNSITNKVSGSLDKDEFSTLTLALKMRTSAGNEYQNLSIGSEFSIQILATQYTSEEDSFDNMYDGGANFPAQEEPSAMVSILTKEEMSNIVIAGANDVKLDTAYQFEPTESAEEVADSEYMWWHADFHVTADADVPANSMMLAGYFELYGKLVTGGEWVGLTSPETIKAGESIRLIDDGLSQMLGQLFVDYNSICTIGNDGIGFLCGAADLTGANEGTTLTVELRIYETDCDAPGCHHNKKECETGNYKTIGTFKYTFDNPNVEYLADGSRVRYGENGEVALESAEKVTVTDGTYYVPYGVTDISGWVLGNNTQVKTIVFPETVRDIQYQAFKGSSIEKVVLNEGLEVIGDYAFNGAKNLKEFNIPSTVKVIAGRAFRETAATTVTIPATVERIEEAFRDMPNLTTVIVEGNTQISPYSFRKTALKEVRLLGDDVTFSDKSVVNVNGNIEGNVGQVFTNADSGAADIKIYVQNETVAERVKVAQSSTYGYEIIVPTQKEITTQDGSASLNVVISEQAKDSIVYHKDLNQYAAVSTIGEITVYTKADLKAAYELWQAGIFAPNGGNGMKAKITLGADIDFGGENFYGFGHEFDIEGGNHTLSNINFVAPEGSFGKAGLLFKGGNNVINNLTIKNATATGAQAGIFGGNIDNVQLNNCALEGNITVNWELYSDASYTEDYNGIGAVWGVISTQAGTQIIDVDTSNANITLNKGNIYYPAGYIPESNNLVGVVYGGHYFVDVDGTPYIVVEASNDAELQAAIAKTPESAAKYIVLNSGTYSKVDFTIAALGEQKGDIYIKAAEGATVIFNDTTTIGLYERGTFNTANWDALVTFEGITFDHKDPATHSIIVQNIGDTTKGTNGLALINCKIVGDGEHGIGSVSGNPVGPSKIIGCTFENAAIQVLGNFGTGLVIDYCTFNNSRINVQGGKGVTVQNCTFNNKYTNLNDNTYSIRSNDIPMTIKNCTFNIDSITLNAGEKIADGKYWTVFCPRQSGGTKWTVSDIKVNFTEAAMNSGVTMVNNLTTVAANKQGRITINGIGSDKNNVYDLIAKTSGYVTVNGVLYLDGVAQ